MVKTAIYWKTEWLKNDNNNCGALLQTIKNNNNIDIVLWSFTKKNGKLWSNVSQDKLLTLTNSNKGLYEIIYKFPHKCYFDIDYKITEANKNEFITNKDFLHNIKLYINSYFPNAKMAISGSYTDEKISFHIILSNYIIKNEDDKKYVCLIVEHLSNKISSFDCTVYSKNRAMKCINQSKLDGRVQDIIENENIKDHFITAFIETENILQYPKLEGNLLLDYEIKKSKSLFDISNLPKLKIELPINTPIHTELTPIEILNLLPLNNINFNHKYTHLVARFCFYNNIDFITFYSWYIKKNNSNEAKIKWEHHWSNLHKFNKTSVENILYILYSFYPKLKHNKLFLNFQTHFNLGIETIKIQSLTKEHLEIDAKLIILKLGMGSGKTIQAINYLNNNPSRSNIWITSGIALSKNTIQRLNTDTIVEWSIYSNFNKQNQHAIPLCNNLLITSYSLHKTDIRLYDTVIIDEIETMLLSFKPENQPMKKFKQQNFKKLIEILKNAKKIIVMDAFITQTTMNFLKNLELENPIIYENLNQPIKRDLIHCQHFKETIIKAINDIKEGKKIGIFYPFKNGSGSISNPIMSMESLKNLIETETNKKGICYNADIDEKIKEDLYDANEAWKDINFIIMNNCITVGVNYDKTTFHKMYIFYAGFSLPRDLVQVSYRFRHLIDNTVNICCMSSYNPVNSWNKDNTINCEIYTQLEKDIFIELKAPLIETVALFFSKANYNQIYEEKHKIDNELKKEFNNQLQKYNVSYDFNAVENIDESICKVIQQKIFSQEATMYEKLCLKKYFLNNRFLNNMKECYREVLQNCWNNQDEYFFDKFLLLHEDHFFNKIKKLNNMDSIFFLENNFNTLKLNKEIRDDIFKEMEFKYITDKVGDKKLLKDIYNSFFGIFIYSKYDKNKNMIYEINDKKLNLFNSYEQLACSNLIGAYCTDDIINEELST